MGGPSEGKAGNNLFTSGNAKEMGRKGGKATSPRKTAANSLKGRKYCNSRCFLFESCPLQPLSEKLIEKSGKKTCALTQKTPKKVQLRILNLFTKGRQGIIDELKRAVYDLSVSVEKSDIPKDRALYVDKLKDFMEGAYGKIIKQEVTGETEITVRWKDDKDTEK